jgi:hypothetical protein
MQAKSINVFQSQHICHHLFLSYINAIISLWQFRPLIVLLRVVSAKDATNSLSDLASPKFGEKFSHDRLRTLIRLVNVHIILSEYIVIKQKSIFFRIFCSLRHSACQPAQKIEQTLALPTLNLSDFMCQTTSERGETVCEFDEHFNPAY